MYFSCTRCRRPVSASGDQCGIARFFFALQTPSTLPLGANRVSWALIAVNHEPRYTAATAADSGVSYVARTMAAYLPRGPVRGRLHGKSMGVGANRGRVCPCVGACDGLHSTAGGCCRWSIEGWQSTLKYLQRAGRIPESCLRPNSFLNIFVRL